MGYNKKSKLILNEVSKEKKSKKLFTLFDLIDEAMDQDGVFEMTDEEFDNYCENFDERFGKGKLNKNENI